MGERQNLVHLLWTCHSLQFISKSNFQIFSLIKVLQMQSHPWGNFTFKKYLVVFILFWFIPSSTRKQNLFPFPKKLCLLESFLWWSQIPFHIAYLFLGLPPFFSLLTFLVNYMNRYFIWGFPALLEGLWEVEMSTPKNVSCVLVTPPWYLAPHPAASLPSTNPKECGPRQMEQMMKLLVKMKGIFVA